MIDYRALKLITKKNITPIPRIDDMMDRLGRATVFSKMDLKTGFHQIRIKPADIDKTEIMTRYGLLNFLAMPMGLWNTPATFKSLMNSVLYAYMDDFVVVYIDYLLIFTEKGDNFRYLELGLERLHKNKLYIGRDKCEFMKDSIDFLGL